MRQAILECRQTTLLAIRIDGWGTALTAAIGMLYFKEPATTVKMVSLTMIIIGVMGLHSASIAK